MKEKESNIEKATGNVLTQSAIAGLSALIGTPLCALLPILIGTLANNRHKERIEKELNYISEQLEKHEEQIVNLTDSQYKLINEIVLTILQTVDKSKLEYLRNSVINCVQSDNITHTKSYVLSRIIRDISANELKYLLSNNTGEIVLGSLDGTNSIDTESEEGEIITGLMSLGLIVPKGGSIDEIGIYIYSAMVGDLLDLIKEIK